MNKKKLSPAVIKLVLSVIALVVAIIFAATLVKFISDGMPVTAPFRKNSVLFRYIFWMALTGIIFIVLFAMGLSELLKAIKFNGMAVKSGIKLKKDDTNRFLEILKKIGKGIAGFFKAIGNEFKDIVTTFVNGDWKTKASYLVMGFGCLARGQILRGILFLLFEVVFIFYMIVQGGYWLSMVPSLGLQEQHMEWVTVGGIEVEQMVPGDNSFKILLYGVLTGFFIIAFIYTWRLNIKQNKIAEGILKSGKKLRSGGKDLKSLVDDQFHKTLLALPLAGILVFTVMPIVFMILVAFTGYDGAHNGINHLFHWEGLTHFNELLNWSSGTKSYSATFGEILVWTIIWAVFATFSNYFLGMLVAMAINKKGIKLKKLWRTVLVMTIAIPQFISLLYVSKMFAKNGLINQFLLSNNIIGLGEELPFWEDPVWARFTVIIINIWIGIPYLMLMVTGILMNIPADLYESAKIDGANGWQQYTKITLPYILFITGPYLLTSFIGNMNNFNVIYLLTGGGPTNAAASSAAGNAGYTDLLITWLFKITMGEEALYYMASVIGIMVFVVVGVIALVVYNVLPSVKNEEDFQ